MAPKKKYEIYLQSNQQQLNSYYQDNSALASMIAYGTEDTAVDIKYYFEERWNFGILHKCTLYTYSINGVLTVFFAVVSRCLALIRLWMENGADVNCTASLPPVFSIVHPHQSDWVD